MLAVIGVQMSHSGVEVLERSVVFRGHFQMLRYRVRHQLFRGGMGPELVRELFARGHAAAVLPFDPVRDEVVLVEQFRVGALEAGHHPWLLEPVAGILEPEEAAADVARREAVEEADLKVLDLAPVCNCFMSPGGSSETVQCYIGRTDTAGAGGVFGLDGEGEDIKVHVLPFAQALARLDDGLFNVASTVLVMQWLARNHDDLRDRWTARPDA
jgi:ADP-ribose pyrophosphatase